MEVVVREVVVVGVSVEEEEGAEEEGDEENRVGEEGGWGCITQILLTKAHVTVTTTFHHAHVVHHKEIDLQLLRACSADGRVGGSYVLHQLHAATVTLLKRRPLLAREGEVERVVTERVGPRRTLVAEHVASRH